MNGFDAAAFDEDICTLLLVESYDDRLDRLTHAATTAEVGKFAHGVNEVAWFVELYFACERYRQ
jgi:hypothetical protein